MPVKPGGNYDRPGRTVGGDDVKTGGATDKPGRALEVDPAKYH